MGAWLRAGLALILIAATGFLVTAEFAIVRARVMRLEALRRRGSRRAGAALALLRDLPRTLATTQIGITLASLGIGWLGEPAIAEILESAFGPFEHGSWSRALSFVLGFLAVTFVTVILGELVPKAIGIQKAEGTLLLAAAPLGVLRFALYPLVTVTNGISLAILKLAGLPSAFGEESAHTEEELRAILGRFHDGGKITRVGRDILERVLGFSRLTARQIMIPRPDVVWLSTSRGGAENLETARSSGYTRFPYCDGDLDHVLGIVHIKDLAAGGAETDLAAVARPPVVVPETATADRMLRLFQKRHLHLAVVVDEYGGTSGIVTLEDVLEEIVGEVQDEFDQEIPEIAPAGEGHFRISGSARLEEAARRLGEVLESPEAEVDTVAGYVQHTLGRIARVGDTVHFGAWQLRVEEIKGNRITRLTADRRAEGGAADGS